jgi:hypothetical protein
MMLLTSRPSRASGVLALLCVGACGTGTVVTTTPLNPAPRPLAPRAAIDVEVFSSAPPSSPYVDLAHLEAEQMSIMSRHGMPEFVDHLRERAAQLGCDGVVVGRPTYSDAREVHGLTGTCIVYVEP